MTDHAGSALVFLSSIIHRSGVLIGTAAVIAVSSGHAQAPLVPPGAGTAGSPYQISQLGHLVWIGDTVASSSGKYYTVQNDMDASDTTNWNSGAGFAPIGGNSGPSFQGSFDGNGKLIRYLSINRPTETSVGLFGEIDNIALVKNVRLVGGGVRGSNQVGCLAGWVSGATVSNCYATGTAAGTEYVGGLAGWISSGTASVCYATGAVTGSNGVGGLVGGLTLGTLSGCYAMGTVAGRTNVGGLVGSDLFGPVLNCYAMGAVSGNKYVAGLVGFNFGSVDRCYAMGAVSGVSSVGGLVGNSGGTVSNSYWDTNTTGQITSAGGSGRTTAQMMQQTTFSTWDFASVWGIHESSTRPFLLWQGPFAGAADLGGGWKWLSWLGFFAENGNDWIYHNEHGWMYTSGTTPASIWFWTSDMGWLWTGNTTYPSIYRSSTGQWLWYQKDSDNPRWFYNFTAGSWESH